MSKFHLPACSQKAVNTTSINAISYAKTQL